MFAQTIKTSCPRGSKLFTPFYRLFSAEECKKKPKVLLVLADGSQEVDVVASFEYLRMAGSAVTLASVPEPKIHAMAYDFFLKTELSVCEAAKCGPYDAILVPGGEGSLKTFVCNEHLTKLLKEQVENQRVVAATCLAPLILKAHKLCYAMNLTAHPDAKEELMRSYYYKDESVVVDKFLITSKSPAFVFPFVLAMVKKLFGPEKLGEVKKMFQ